MGKLLGHPLTALLGALVLGALSELGWGTNLYVGIGLLGMALIVLAVAIGEWLHGLSVGPASPAAAQSVTTNGEKSPATVIQAGNRSSVATAGGDAYQAGGDITQIHHHGTPQPAHDASVTIRELNEVARRGKQVNEDRGMRAYFSGQEESPETQARWNAQDAAIEAWEREATAYIESRCPCFSFEFDEADDKPQAIGRIIREIRANPQLASHGSANSKTVEALVRAIREYQWAVEAYVPALNLDGAWRGSLAGSEAHQDRKLAEMETAVKVAKRELALHADYLTVDQSRLRRFLEEGLPDGYVPNPDYPRFNLEAFSKRADALVQALTEETH
jgi:hypothetical protein